MDGLDLITRGLNVGGDYVLANKGLGVSGRFAALLKVVYEIIRLKSRISRFIRLKSRLWWYIVLSFGWNHLFREHIEINLRLKGYLGIMVLSNLLYEKRARWQKW